MVKRVKLGGSLNQLKLTYIQQVRSVLEIAVPAWQPGLTIANKLNIKRVQRSVCHIILGREFNDYNEALATLGLDTLENRRLMLCETFVLKTYEEKKFSHWFKLNDNKSKNKKQKNKIQKHIHKNQKIQNIHHTISYKKFE